jgi:hypothetical protein
MISLWYHAASSLTDAGKALMDSAVSLFGPLTTGSLAAARDTASPPRSHCHHNTAQHHHATTHKTTKKMLKTQPKLDPLLITSKTLNRPKAGTGTSV